MTVDAGEVLDFWFPADLGDAPDQLIRQVQWWFRGGSNTQVRDRFAPLLMKAGHGELESWKETPRTRLALILVLDQFSRAIYQEDARAYATDSAALSAAAEGMANGHYDALESPWEQTFFSLPFGHSEKLEHVNLAVTLAEEIARGAPPQLQTILGYSVEQARGHRDVIARFGRHPHRNRMLGRDSTPAELEYLESTELVHKRALPGKDG